MSVSVARLRVWLLVGAGLLVVVIAAFVGVAHYKAHRFIAGLPAKLGIDIQQETTGFTYSQSSGPKGKTIYTIHAAKAQRRKDGKLALHDVVIVLYGKGEGSQQRADRIYGNEFEYEESSGVVRAIGEVHIDLQAPAPQDPKAKSEYAKGDAQHGKEIADEHRIHVTTSDLVFLQKLGTAATSEDLEFEYNGMTGHAHGADYSTDSGDLVLESGVKMNGMKSGRPVVLMADRAEFERGQGQLMLRRAVYTVSEGPAGTRVAKANQMTAYLRQDGSVERAVGEGGVSMVSEDGSTLTATRGEAHLNAASQPQMMSLTGSVRYVSNGPLRQASGEGDEGHAEFDGNGLLKHAVMTGGVHLRERTAQAAGWSERDLVSKMVDLVVTPGGGKKIELKEAQARGSSRLTVVSDVLGVKGGVAGKRTSVLQGDLLTASFETAVVASAPLGVGGKAKPDAKAQTQLKTVVGEGHTVLRRVSESGAEATSSGDRLNVDFRDAQKTAVSAVKGQSTEEIASAVQEGHVAMMNRPVMKPGVEAAEQHGTAQRARYNGDTDEVTLSGTVQLVDADSMLWADEVVMQHETGDGTARGSVRASYLQPKNGGAKQGGAAGEPVHVLAARAEFKHDSKHAVFYGEGSAGGRARLWEGASQVEAPVIELEQTERRLLAHGDARSTGMVVHSVFVSASPQTVTKPTDGKSSAQAPVRVTSRDLVYDDSTRRADFTGGVIVENVDGTMRAQQAVAYLKAADATTSTAKAPQSAFMSGSVERIVATGKVEMVQPGRRVTGEKLVYTAVDGMSVITGLPGVPPKITDVAQGTITGASLRFHAGDNEVVVSNGPDDVPGQRVHTETRVK